MQKPRELSVEQLDEETRRRSLAAMPREIALLDDLLLHLNHGLASLSGSANDRGLNFLAMLLLTRTAGSLWRAREDAIRGYPVQSLILCRTVLEDWATVRYAEAHPEAIAHWLDGVIPEAKPQAKSGRRPTLTAMLKELPDPLRSKARETYRLLSWFVHPEGTGLRWLFHFDKETTFFHSAGYFSRRGLTTCLYFSVVLAQMLLERAAQLQFRVRGDVPRDWLERGIELSDAAGEFIDLVHASVSMTPDVSRAAAQNIEDYRSGLQELERF